TTSTSPGSTGTTTPTSPTSIRTPASRVGTVMAPMLLRLRRPGTGSAGPVRRRAAGGRGVPSARPDGQPGGRGLDELPGELARVRGGQLRGDALQQRPQDDPLVVGQRAEQAVLDVVQPVLELPQPAQAGVGDRDAPGAPVGRVGAAFDQPRALQ